MFYEAKKQRQAKVGLLVSISFLVFFALSACTNSTSEITTSKNEQLFNDSNNWQSAQKTNIATKQLNKNELTSIYSLAIKQFIKTVHKKDKIHFDTLYFGKHVFEQADDFPNIELPAKIESTQIRLIDPALGLSLQQKNNALVYINMIGWVDQVNASFILVIFSNGGQHQYDYFIDYDYNSKAKNYTLKRITLEDYRKLIESKPIHINLFSDGKYTFK